MMNMREVSRMSKINMITEAVVIVLSGNSMQKPISRKWACKCFKTVINNMWQ